MVEIHFINLRDKFVANRLFDKTKNSLFVLKLMSLFFFKRYHFFYFQYNISFVSIVSMNTISKIFTLHYRSGKYINN